MPKMFYINRVKSVDEREVDDMRANGWRLMNERPAPPDYEVESDDYEDDGYPPMILSHEGLSELDAAQLADYAKAHGVDVGRATTEKGILDKIVEAGKVHQAEEPQPETEE